MEYPYADVNEKQRNQANALTAEIEEFLKKYPSATGVFNKCEDRYQQNYEGYLAEIVYADYFKISHQPILDINGDKCDFVHFGKKVDVKNKVRNVDPQPDYVAEVASRLITKPIDVFMFLSFNKRSQRFFFVGWLPREVFRKKARFFRKGQKRMQGNYEYIHKNNSYEVNISELLPISEWKEE